MKGRYIPKVWSFKRLDSKSISDKILKNSLIFLLEGIQQIENNPRQSIVVFWTGVELFIKALLVAEHWSLIVKDTRDISQEKFEKGDFVSVDFLHAIKLLENIYSVSLEKKTRVAFDALRKHRNKIIHFVNCDVENKSALDLCDIFLEMGNVWEELQGLYLPPFGFDENELYVLYNEITKAVESHKIILDGKYRQVFEDKLRHLNNDEVLLCNSCGYKAVLLSPIIGFIYEAKCLVCGNSVDIIKIKCAFCDHLNILHKSENTCSNCHKKLDLISHVLGDSVSMNDYSVATCHRCRTKSVIRVGSAWFCLECFSFHSTVNACDSCSSLVTHSVTNSNEYGCICCEE